MIHHFDHRFGTYEGQTQAQANMGTLLRLTPYEKGKPFCVALPYYWVAETEVNDKLQERWNKGWLLGWRGITHSGNERTTIAALFPTVAVGNSLPLMFVASIASITLLSSSLSSFVLDFVARQKVAGNNVNFFVMEQLPVLPADRYKLSVPWVHAGVLDDWIEKRALELIYTAWDIEAFARDAGDCGAPFVWDDGRRFKIRAELDAAFFHLYGIEREDVDYIMDSFRAFRNNDPERFARTKVLILEIYDAMAAAMKTGDPYQTILDPRPVTARATWPGRLTWPDDHQIRDYGADDLHGCTGAR
jgi:hypothetical protein